MIEVRNITKIYGSTIAVDDITFSVKRGEVIGFLGPNGAGKSTTMKMITGYIPPSSGKARVAGFDIFENPLEVKRRIGYMPETVPLYTDMTVFQYLEFMAKIKGVEVEARSRRLKEIMGRCGVEDVRAKLIGKLSKGYRQRVGLAQALIHDPEILILDEPSVGLDPGQIIEIRNLIKEIGEKKTVILSSHILPEVSMTCERVIIIHQGKIVASDRTESLTSQLQRGEQLSVKIQGDKEAVQAGLAGLENVSGVRLTTDEDDVCGYIVESGMHNDIRRELAAFVVGKGWGLLELKARDMSLEDIFLQLTTREQEIQL